MKKLQYAYLLLLTSGAMNGSSLKDDSDFSYIDLAIPDPENDRLLRPNSPLNASASQLQQGGDNDDYEMPSHNLEYFLDSDDYTIAELVKYVDALQKKVAPNPTSGSFSAHNATTAMIKHIEQTENKEALTLYTSKRRFDFSKDFSADADNEKLKKIIDLAIMKKIKLIEKAQKPNPTPGMASTITSYFWQ